MENATRDPGALSGGLGSSLELTSGLLVCFPILPTIGYVVKGVLELVRESSTDSPLVSSTVLAQASLF